MSPRTDDLVRTRDGDLVPADSTAPHVCDRGWLRREDGLAPCPTCRPEAAQRIRDQRQRAAARRAGTYAAPRHTPDPPQTAAHTPITTTPEERTTVPDPTTTTTAPASAVAVSLTPEQLALVVKELDRAAYRIIGTAAQDAASIVSVTGRDNRTQALRLTERLAHAEQLQSLVKTFTNAQATDGTPVPPAHEPTTDTAQTRLKSTP